MFSSRSTPARLFDRFQPFAPGRWGAFRLLALVLVAALVALPLVAQDAAEPAPAEGDGRTVAVGAVEEEVVEGEESETVVIPGVSLVKRFLQGGWTMWVILALSLVMVTFAIERLMNLTRKNCAPDGLADEARAAWATGDLQQVTVVCQRQPSVLAEAIGVMARHPQVPAGDMSNMVGDEVSRLMRAQLQKAYPLAIVATLAPLLGLLGTVMGMIEAFEVVAVAGSLGDASLLAGGISKALVTTAFGLIVAIPALGLYHLFRSRTHQLSLDVEEEADELISDWFHAAADETPAA
ncbi:MAG: MotA/TolQ/ExbB proton channel family protein [Verrucomicrobiota bacterium]